MPGENDLRIALLAMMEPAGAGEAVRRASLFVAGQSIARHQVDVARALRCGVVVCLTDSSRPELIVLRAAVESAGMRFEIAHDAADLRRLCGAGDQLLVMADGLLAEPDVSVELMQAGEQSRAGGVVLVQPAEIALPLGFERLDLTRAVGGMMLVPGGLLAELPDGYDVPSALTRIALQAGVPTREVPQEVRRGGHWRLVRSEAEAHAIDDEWVAFNLGEGRDAGPSEALARLGVRAFGSSLLHAGSSSRILVLGSTILLLLAFAAGWLGAWTTGFALVALGSLVGHGGLLLLRVERGAATPQATPRMLSMGLDWLCDALILLLAIWAAPRFPDATLVGRAFAPVMLVVLLHLVPRLYLHRFARWLADRAIVALVLALAAALRSVLPGVELIVLALGVGAAVHVNLGSGKRV